MKFLRILALALSLCLLAGCVTACGSTETPADTAGTTTGEAATTAPAPAETEASATETDATTAGTEATTSTTASTATTSATKTATTIKTVNHSVTSTTKQPSKNVVTYTTEAPETTTTKDKSKGKAIKILAVGNSFSVDAMNQHLFKILESAGYTDITLGNLYIGGCSLDTHYENLKRNKAEYVYYQNTDGEWSQTGGSTPGSAFQAFAWDYVTIQQVSSDSGRPATYQNLTAVLDLIRQFEPKAKILWHMTWAYQKDSDHWAFQYYDKDQMTMYNAITATVQEQVKPLSAIYGILPAGTAIQNLRTSGLGDTLTSDGHHLLDTYGDYTAALTWFCAITGESPDVVTYRPNSIKDYWKEIAQSVQNAVKTPFAVTKCK